MLIRDLVTLNAEAEFVNDVQLGWYPNDPKNRTLAKGYIFTDKAPEGKKSSIDLLEMVRNAFITDRENRFVVIATYGHGKTHFALALANFFGKAADTQEVRQMLVNIEHASSESKAQGLRDFKEARPPYLVVRLRGDKPGSLSQQFLRGLEDALNEQEATRGARLPLWFDEAGQFLGRLTPEQREKADAFLKAYELDTELLLRQVRERAADRYEVCRLLSREIYGSTMDFGSEVSLDHVVKLAVDDYCGEGKPYTGLLILFDEFSEFIRRYAERRGVGGASLQDLLNGVNSRRERVAFVAFSQHDPDTVAQNVYRLTADTHGQDSLSKELTRLPVPQRQTLFSSLETVLAAYLKQHEDNWESLYDRAVTALDEATDRTLELFEARYGDSLGWDTEKVSEVLTRGCFPLHPLTTALLCSVSLREVTNPRAVLGFVEEALGRCQEEDAILNHRPNWVYATDLVDYFGEMLAEKEWEQFEAVRGALGGDITESQARILRAMLLVAVARLKARSLGYAKVIALLCGLPVQECQATLTELSENGHIQHDSSAKTYAFWTAGASGNRLDKEIKKLLDSTLNIEALNREWSSNGTNRLGTVEMGSVTWGSPKDYEAKEFLLTRSTFTADQVRRMAATFKADANLGITEGARGYLFWLVAETEEDIDWFRENAQSILDASLPGANPPPVVLALPAVTRPQFVPHVLRAQALQRLSQDTRREYGAEVLRTTEDRYRQAVDDELKHIKGTSQFEVPFPYRANLAQQGTVRTAARALEVCYQVAYHDAPSAFFTQFTLSSPNLRKAVCRLSSFLSENRMGASDEAQNVNPVARELMTKFLRVGPPSSWGVVTVGEDVRPPASSRSLRAWTHLDAAFKPGQAPRSVREALVPLFNAPFGYDYNHTLLLFSAWYGLHQRFLALYDGPQRTSLSAILHKQEKPKDVILALCRPTVSLARKDQDVVEKDLNDLLLLMSEQNLTRAEARSALANLAAMVKDEKLAENQRVRVQSARERVERGLARANEYETATEDLRLKIERASAVDTLVQQYQQLSKLPALLCVRDGGPDKITSLQTLTRRRLQEVVEAQCVNYSKLGALEDYSMRRGILINSIQKPVHLLGMPHLSDRVEVAIANLDARREELKQVQEKRQQDSDIVAELRAIQAVGPLLQLRQSLARLDEFEPRASETKAQIERKREALAHQIAVQEQFVAGLPDRLDTLTDAVSAHKLFEDIQRRYNSYADTPEFETIQSASSRCEALEAALTRLTSYKNAASSAKTPQQIEELLTKATRTRERAAASLNDKQADQFMSLEADLGRLLANGRRAAQDWLNECRRDTRELAPQTINTLLIKLERPHPFLAEGDAPAVEAMRTQVQQKMDENEVEAITQRFRRISDPKKRRACLEALQQIAGAEAD